MARAKTMHGSRAQLSINGTIVGIFNSVSYGVEYEANAVYILGRFNAAEIALTGMNVINIQASGYRVVGSGPYAVSEVPKLQDLLNHEDITLAIFDRQSTTGEPIMQVTGVRPTGWNTSISARGLQDLTVTFQGLALSDESGDQDETKTATPFPT
jgi:hypothetical protein